MRLLDVLIAGLLSCFALGCFPATFTVIPPVMGTVVDLNGRPVNGAVVDFSRTPGTSGPKFSLQLKTNEDGLFSCKGKVRWSIYIVPADLLDESAQLQAHHLGGGALLVARTLTYKPGMHLCGFIGREQTHDVGELQLPVLIGSHSWC